MNITKIYLVENCYGDPNKVYIGKTKGSRKYPHIRNFGSKIKYTYIDEINSLDRKEWEPLETFWIQYFIFLGFDIQNIKRKGGSGPDFHTEETKQRMRNSAKGKSPKPIYQYDLEGNFIKEFLNINEIYKELGTKNCVGIYNCCRNIISTSHGFIWKYKNINLSEENNLTKRKSNIKYELYINEIFIGLFENRQDIIQYGINNNTITKCLSSDDNIFKDIKIIKIQNHIKNKPKESKCSWGVKPKSLICNETGKIYKSREDCSNEMGFDKGSLGRFLNGKYGSKTLKGYTFSYL